MILKDDHRSTVEIIDNGFIKKTFKSDWKLNTNLFNDDWKNHINNFAEQYGNFPKITSLTKDELVMQYVIGEPLEALREESYYSSIDEQIKIFKKMQYYYLKFISNISEYNLNNNVTLTHTDLNFGNMFISNDKLVCIDLESIFLNRNACENSFISFFLTRLNIFADNINFQHKNREYSNLLEQQREINLEHKEKIKELDNKIKDLKSNNESIFTKTKTK